MATVTSIPDRKSLSSSFTVDAHEGGPEIIDEWANQWRELCVGNPDDQPFYRPEWIRAYLRAFAPTARILLLTVRDGLRLHLILPLVKERGTFSGVLVRKLRAPVNAHSCRFDAVRTPGPEGEVAIGLAWNFLKNLNNWDLLEFRSVVGGSTIDLLSAEARANQFHAIQVLERPNPYLPLPGDPGLLTQMPLNARLRTKLRQARRQLADQAPLRLLRFDAADRNALGRFYELEGSGWKGEERSAIVCTPETRQFYDEIAESAARFGYFSLYLLEWKSELLAAHFSLNYGKRCYSPKVAYNEKFKEFAPGHLLVSEILQDCAARGIEYYDITGPDDDWKMKWTANTQSVHHHLIFGSGAFARLAFVARFRIRPAIGQLLRRGKRDA